MSKGSCDIGLIGLAVMGQNLVLNMNDHGYKVAVFNRTVSKVDDIPERRGEGNAGGGRALDGGVVRAAEVAAPRDADGEGGRCGGPEHRAASSASGEGRHHHRRRQLAVHRFDPAHQVPGGEGDSVYRHRRLGRRGGRAARPVDHAGRQSGGVAACEGDLPGDLRPRWRTERPAATGWARTARATTSRWCTTASSTATCS